jgi:oligosaccharide repeat unit polymerase
MSWISWICFGICSGIILSIFRREADPLSPARVFGFIWSLSIGLTDLKLSGFQHTWDLDSWILLLIAVMSFLVGTFIAYVLNLKRKLVPIPAMRKLLKQEDVHETRLFWLIILGVIIYSVSYLINFLVKGWLPIFTLGTSLTRVDFNVTGLTFLIDSVSFISFFILLYYLKIEGKRSRKIFLTIMLLIVVGSFLLIVSRYHIILIFIICIPLFYYATHYIRLRTVLTLFLSVTAFFYWISSIRFSHVVATFLYSASKMKFPKDYAMLTEPYMYSVMNLENFARSVNQLDYHTYGYYTFDFITAIAGLKYWIYNYFNMDRTPYITSSYNTYTAFWWFFIDFGVIGLALIPWVLGFSTGLLYYRMRKSPSIKNVTAYGVMVFVMFISYFNFPLSFLWFEFNLLVMYLFLRWTIIPRKESA